MTAPERILGCPWRACPCYHGLRQALVQAAPRALAVEQQRELLRAAETSRARDRAIVTLLLYTGLRLNELVSLDVDDVSI